MIFTKRNVTYFQNYCIKTMSDQIVKKILKLGRKDISHIKFLFEGYEGLCTITTVDKDEAVIELTILPDFISDVNRILDALREEVDFQEVVS